MNNFEKEYYEAPEFWSENALSDQANAARIKQTAELIPCDASTLVDVGCGNGLFGHYLAQHESRIHVTSIDRSEQALSHVKTDKAVGEVTKIPAVDRQFDVASCLQVLEHIPFSNYDKALEELARVAAKYLLISVPFKEDLLVNATCCPNCQSRFNADLHLRSYDDSAIQELFSDYGFKLIRSANLIQSRAPIGIEYYQRFRSILTPAKSTFASPICPVCGYLNPTFKKPVRQESEGRSRATLANATFSIAKGLRLGVARALRPVWPEKVVQGYWIIALYQRTSE